MKRNRAGEDELNPTSNNRSVLESARPGRAGDAGSGGEGRWVLSCVRLFAIPWTVALQTPLFMEFSRQE